MTRIWRWPGRSNAIIARRWATARRFPDLVNRLGNFAGTTFGVVTRRSSNPKPPADSLYGTTIGALRCDALPVPFDLAAWRARFLAQWPPGSPGYLSYFARAGAPDGELPEFARKVGFG
jgi:hypothetical protein